MKNTVRWICSLALCTGLAACSDDNDDDGDTTPTVDAGGGGEVTGDTQTGTALDGEGNEISGSEVELVRNDDGVHAKATVPGLTAGNAYNAGWLFFNDPSSCATNSDPADGEPRCGPDDIALASVAFAGAETGVVADEAGQIVIPQVSFLTGDEVVSGDGLGDTAESEVHFFIVDHGVAEAEGAALDEQLSTLSSGCEGECPSAAWAAFAGEEAPCIGHGC